MSQPKVRSTTQRSGMTFKPFWPGPRRVTSTSMPRVVLWSMALAR
ncbi:hypothetical protein JOF58_000918 [Streptomyces cinnamonensis]|nr:hypothetical protein [Streptomyces virginiae]